MSTPLFQKLGPDEAVVLTFNYADELVAGEQLEGVIDVEVTVTSGVDAGAPNSVLNGVAAYNTGQTQVLQPVKGAVSGCVYYFKVTAPTTNPKKTLTRYALLEII